MFLQPIKELSGKYKLNYKMKKTKTVTGAEAVILCLIEESANVMFGYVGGAIMPVYDALYDYHDKISHILTRHEQGAIHAAQGFARASGQTGVCIATSGPGATNLITGLADAQLDSTPLVCITGQVASGFLGSDAFQEQDIISISMPVTKWNFQVTKPEEIPMAISKAFYLAKTGRPGPVLIDITKDAQFGKLEFSYSKTKKLRSYFPYPIPDELQLKNASTLINNAKKPLILAGHGILLSGAQEKLIEFAEKAGIPVASTLLGLSAFPTDHALMVGLLGMHGNYGANIKTNEADLIIAIGMRFDDRVTGKLSEYATQAKVIHIDIDKSEINKNVKADVPLIGDAKEVLSKLIPKVKKNFHQSWMEEFNNCYKIEYEKVIHKHIKPEKGNIHMGEVIHLISEMTHGEAIIVTDVGQNQMFSARYYKFKNTNSFISSGGLGTMGFGLPAALGAKLGAPTREVILVVGDGGFQMTIQELATYFQNNIAVKIVILNNNFLGMVRQWQEMFFNKRYSYTEMINPDFVAIAKGYNLKASKVTQRRLLKASINSMLNHKGPFVLEIEVEREANVLPMVAAGESVSNVILE
jgi:acetolactate synthase I/II/III large subunit